MKPENFVLSMIVAGGESLERGGRSCRIYAPSCGLSPTRIIALPHARHVNGRLKCDKACKYCSFRNRLAIFVTTGSTRSIHGVAHGPPGAKIRCMSRHR